MRSCATEFTWQGLPATETLAVCAPKFWPVTVMSTLPVVAMVDGEMPEMLGGAYDTVRCVVESPAAETVTGRSKPVPGGTLH